MLIALGFFLLSMIFGGGSPFIIPKLDSYVKTHVVDDGRKEIVLGYLKNAKVKRKISEKKNIKYIDEFKEMLKLRETTKEDFDLIIKKIRDAQAVSGQANIEANIEAQKNITAEEWEAINTDITKALGKSNKQATKINEDLSKAYDKWKMKIAKTIAEKSKREKAIDSAEKLKVLYLKNREIIQKEVANKNSILYQYKASKEELNKMQNAFINIAEEVLQAAVTTHFELIELTTKAEWKSIL